MREAWQHARVLRVGVPLHAPASSSLASLATATSTATLPPTAPLFRGLPTPTPGTAGEVGTVSFSRPGGGCTRFNMPAPLPPTHGTPSGPSSPSEWADRGG